MAGIKRNRWPICSGIGGRNGAEYATTASYNDTGAPADGSGRYYKCVLNATGAAQQTSTSDRGYRAIAAPTVTTQAATSVEETTATGNGNITNTGGENCSRRGFCYKVGTSGDPTTADSVAYDDGNFGTGPYTKGLTGLSPGTNYRVRAYAVNSAGTGYGTTVQILTKPAAPANVAATDGAHTDKVVITWTKSTGATGYQVYRNGAALGWLGDVATDDDTGAAAPTITPGTAAASDGTNPDYVSLSLSGQSANNGTTHTYKVRAKNATGESVDSGTDTGYRGVGSLTYQWQRSAADSDADYSNIAGATTASHNDTGAPADGSGRYYKCVLNATGASQQISTADRGYRAIAAPTVTSITPSKGTTDDNALGITNLAGTGFLAGASVELNYNGANSIAATGVVVASSTKITCTFNLSGVTTNLGAAWDVKVTNTDAQSGTGNDLFTIYRPNPTVTSITPNTGVNTGTVNITNLAGTKFIDGSTTVKLTKAGQADINGTSVVVVSTTKIICTFNLAGAAAGAWDVVVTVAGAESSGTLGGGFTVTAAASQVILTGPSTVTAGSISTAFTLTSQDAKGNTANVTQDTVFSLTSNSTGTATFYSDAGGTTAITQVTISNGSSSATFYYKDTETGTPTVTATRTSGMLLGSATHQVTVSLATTTLATSTSVALSFKNFKVTVTKIEMNNGTSWVTIFSGTAELDLVNGGTFPGISDLALLAGTYNQIRVTFRNSLLVTGTLNYSGTDYYTTAATFGGESNVASTPDTNPGSEEEFTFRIDDWGAVNADVIQTYPITPIKVGPATDYQPTLRFTISNKLLFKGTAGTASTYYFASGVPTVSIVEP